MNKNDWKSIQGTPPPQGVIVETKIHDAAGERNVQPLILQGRLWWLRDKSMYVYYTPTHWRYIF